MTIIKLGGSLFANPNLRHWLSAISAYSKTSPTIIVPGGGPFADLVRSAQKQHHYDDSTAHHMALLAMAQFGLLLHSKLPDAKLLHSIDDANFTTPLSIWMPNHTLLNEPQLAHSWDISSDSLALYLAQQRNATQLILIKSAQIMPTPTIELLSMATIIDPNFQLSYVQQPITTYVIEAADHYKLRSLSTLRPLTLS